MITSITVTPPRLRFQNHIKHATFEGKLMEFMAEQYSSNELRPQIGPNIASYPCMKLRRFLKYVNAEHKGPELQFFFHVMQY